MHKFLYKFYLISALYIIFFLLKQLTLMTECNNAASAASTRSNNNGIVSEKVNARNERAHKTNQQRI